MTTMTHFHDVSVCEANGLSGMEPRGTLSFTDAKGNRISIFMDLRLAEAMKEAWDEFHSVEPEPADAQAIAINQAQADARLQDAGRL
jgi:hypothetical protein